ncbi:MAG: DASS family sodium-coupled anion symporter [Balneolales bacterium]
MPDIQIESRETGPKNGVEGTGSGLATRQIIGLVLGPVIFILMLLSPAPEGLGEAGWATAAIGSLMAIWWITEAIPIPATSLLPLVLFPLLGVVSMNEAASPYANPLVFLFMGGFMIAIAMQTWNLHRRIALNIVQFVGVKPTSIIIGFMIASAFLSMWVSNTATTLMMLPIGLSIITLARDNASGDADKLAQRNFGIALILSIAYACNIGGLATIIGTPPNAVLAGFMNETYGVEVGFAQWMSVGVPLVIVTLPLAYLVLTKITFPIEITELPGGKEIIDRELKSLGTVTNPEKKVAVIFLVTGLMWMFRPLLSNHIDGLTDTGIAIAAALILFLTPVNFKKGKFILNWNDVEKLPWGVLILFGGGLSLAHAIAETGFAEWIGMAVAGLGNWPILMIVLIAVSLIMFLTEITSNTATAAAFLPILAAVAIGIGENPLILIVPAALAASCAFMLPVATPPNAIVYSTGLFTIPQMVKAGLWLNLLFIIVITAFCYIILGIAFNVEVGLVPDWVR